MPACHPRHRRPAFLAAAVLLACRGATDPAASVPAVDGTYTFRAAFDSVPDVVPGVRDIISLGGTLTLRRIGPVERDCATGRAYARLAGTAVYQQCAGAVQGQQFCFTDTAAVGVYAGDSAGVAAYAHGDGTYVDDAGHIRIVAAYTYELDRAVFRAALALAGGGLSGTATKEVNYSHGAPTAVVSGTMMAERVP